mmetsp:Transcript_6902/g.14240  ORF Transcript_6902/g.14240 Transcript_6902/m.14240 type:complete len:136 (+) Transcript_6902:68-475(+)
MSGFRLRVNVKRKRLDGLDKVGEVFGDVEDHGRSNRDGMGGDVGDAMADSLDSFMADLNQRAATSSRSVSAKVGSADGRSDVESSEDEIEGERLQVRRGVETEMWALSPFLFFRWEETLERNGLSWKRCRAISRN